MENGNQDTVLALNVQLIPLTKKNDEMILEAVFGLGELLVQGEITPTRYIIDKRTENVKSIEKHPQEEIYTFAENIMKKVTLPDRLKNKLPLTHQQIDMLLTYAEKIEKHFKKPQDIEWAIEKGKIFILQSRPITGK